MKRRIEIRIDELRLPSGTRGGLLAIDAIRSELALLLSGTERSAPNQPHAAVARAIHEHVAPHVTSKPPKGPPR